MSAVILTHRRAHMGNTESKRQEYELAKDDFQKICRLYKAANPEHQKRFQSALERKNLAFEEYIRSING